ncbi:MAG TPA: tetratricopeptide repeat protein [Candidatus Acidoferrales bacterium]|nr:tetratricopeptide repeat protein [Candidatus Acidoferrales bacterium]
MVTKNNPTQALTAKSATIIFTIYFVAQLLCVALCEAIGGASLRPLAEFFVPIIGLIIMVLMAFRLIPNDIVKNDPTSPAWKLGNWKNLVKGLSIGCAIGVGHYFLNPISSSPPPHGNVVELNGALIEPVSQMIVTPGAEQVLAIVLLALLGPVCEEMMFRGILYGGYRKSFGPLWAALVTSGIFVAIHFPYYINVPHKIVPYIVDSFVLLWCRLHWKAIGPAITAHSGINIFAVIIPSLIWTWGHGYYELGVSDYKASNFRLAIANLTHAIQLGNSSSNAYIYRGDAKLEQRDINGAISDFSKAIELNPNDSKAFYDRGLAKYRNADLEGAIADYDHAIALNSKYIKAYYYRASARLSLGKLDAAITDYGMAIELNPTNALYYNDRGWAEFLKGDFDSSIADATRAIQLYPNVGYAYGTRGWARYRTGDVSGAVEDCKRATQLFKPGSAAFFHDQGLLDFIAGDYKTAIADWQNAIEQELDFKKELQPWIEKAQKNL